MKYKLIQPYPGSPKLGIIHDSEKAFNSDWKGTRFYDAHPEFWQKVEEVDYQILSFQDKRNRNIITYRKSKNVFIIESASDSDYKGYSLEQEMEFVKDGYYIIHSVKRLSDGEVFTVGDLIDFADFGNKGFQKIDKFEIDYFDKTRISACNSAYGLGIVRWNKAPAKTPLFTTEDGVNVFDGDKFSAVNKNSFKLAKNCYKKGDEPELWIYFSTKEKAQEYIINNKPCLSIVELQKWFMEYGIQLTGLDRLKEIVKNKL